MFAISQVICAHFNLHVIYYVDFLESSSIEFSKILRDVSFPSFERSLKTWEAPDLRVNGSTINFGV